MALAPEDIKKQVDETTKSLLVIAKGIVTMLPWIDSPDYFEYLQIVATHALGGPEAVKAETKLFLLKQQLQGPLQEFLSQGMLSPREGCDCANCRAARERSGGSTNMH